MKKRIIFFSVSMCMGGIENALVKLLDRLDYSKYDVTLFLEKKEGELLSKINKNVEIYNYDICESSNIIYRKIKNGIKRLKFILKNKNKYDFSCCYATYSKPCSLFSQIVSSNNAIYIHGDYVLEYNDDEKTINFFKNQKINNFKKVVFVSNESRNNLINIMPYIKEKSVVINNFIDYEDIIEKSKEEIKEKKNGKIVLLYVGRLDEKVKKISRIINAIYYLKSKNKNVELWIVGDGQDYNYYKNMIEEKKLISNVKMLGLKINPYPYIKKCDYLVISSDHEGFPVTMLESLVLNKTIISTIKVSDSNINIEDYGYLVSKNQNEFNKQIFDIISSNQKKDLRINFQKIEQEKLIKIEKLIEGELNEI